VSVYLAAFPFQSLSDNPFWQQFWSAKLLAMSRAGIHVYSRVRFPTVSNKRGINHTDWIRIDRATYDACLDSRDYRPKPTTP